MSAIDFKEIPEAHIPTGQQDTFELFSRDFLTFLGYKIDEEPSRGADGGKDLVVIENRSGVGGESKIRWLVSCKHKAHSGSSVNHQDELNIRDRVEANHCHGFIGFYSTLASSGLSNTLAGLKSNIESQIFDKEKIESYLLKSREGLHLGKRFFPISIAKWIGKNSGPVKVFSNTPSLKCKHCNKDLLLPNPSGIIVLWYKTNEITEKKHYSNIYWCCKGNCDQHLSPKMRLKDHIDGWEDIPDVMIPIVYSRWISTPLNELNNGDTFSPEAFDNLKIFILSIFPFIARETTEEENLRIDVLVSIPSQFGGLGF